MTTPPDGNIADLVRAAAATFGDRAALIGDGDDRSWAQLDAAADTGAAFLASTGARAGDRVLLALPNSADLALALIAVARAGLVAVPVDPARSDTQRVAGRMQATVGIAIDHAHGLPIAITSVQIADWWTTQRSKFEAVGGGEQLAQLARASRGHRAVMIPHRAVLAAVAAVVATPGLGLRMEDRALLALPLHHLAGFVTAFLPMTAVGGAAVLPANQAADRADAAGATDVAGGVDNPMLTAIRRHRVTILPGSPPVYRQLLRADGAERALATVRLMTSGAAPLLPEDFSAARALTGQSVWEGYGISESTSVIATSLMTSHARPGSVGLPVSGLELRVVPDVEPEEEATDTLADVGSIGEVGRIAIRGQMLFLGYWPDAADGPADDGWYLTSDVGYADDSGELHLVDRAADTFVVAGFTVYPREIERVLADHPYVADAAVVGYRTDTGTAVVAVIAPRAGKHPTDDDIAEFLADRLPTFKRPTAFQLVSELPRTELGRVDRPAALADYAEAAGIDLSSQPASTLAPVPTEIPAATVAAAAGPAAEQQDDHAETADTATVPDQAKPTVAPAAEVSPEVAAPLDQLGKRLPSAGSRGGRGAKDSDDDLFGDDYS
ncbi:MAG: AMP-binding protein [Actinomycetota bacterium]|nr:AMP-binding protein [Actinomycetota bacterium]